MVTATRIKANVLSDIIDKIESILQNGQGEVRVCIKNHYIYKVEKVETDLYLNNP